MHAANERTFLHWMNMSVTIGSISAALLGVHLTLPDSPMSDTSTAAHRSCSAPHLVHRYTADEHFSFTVGEAVKWRPMPSYCRRAHRSCWECLKPRSHYHSPEHLCQIMSLWSSLDTAYHAQRVIVSQPSMMLPNVRCRRTFCILCGWGPLGGAQCASDLVAGEGGRIRIEHCGVRRHRQ